ncbi:chromate transporter-domain-containing protein [Amylocarpus encephaloides]|uniref:Chromate transporter-domain-containing protein n=1 Tax=Amylocarpus encephaloides TaxID=45428 RepID=A0A9P7YTU4_9HELO|nr:chromate transporter-domain-containing protein [Amylocarpus encephaloides]
MAHPRTNISIREGCRQIAGLLATARSTSNSNTLACPEGLSQVLDFLRVNWHLGFTAFGSPPVHFQIFHRKFVEKEKWIDEQLYQEIFAICQATPGPGSTKMFFVINYIHGGFVAGLFAFILWCLPGALGMYGLSLGVSRIGDKLPAPVYALLSGLNAATVGIIALAAVQLAEKAITDQLTRMLVFLGGVAGMLYTALWYYPVLMFAAGVSTVIWDYHWLHTLFRPFWRSRDPALQVEEQQGQIENPPTIALDSHGEDNNHLHLRRIPVSTQETSPPVPPGLQANSPRSGPSQESVRVVPSSIELNIIDWKSGIYIFIAFFTSFLTIMILRSLLKSPPLGLSLFNNLYLAGTIIFGGGPVVIPLLREYIVAEGWVSPRDFLLGLAIIQAFPGPNFNFAVYLGALATANSSLPSFAGALIGAAGIFTPGLVIITGIMGFWTVLRSKRWLLSLLRGVNAGAVGLVFTAVYKLWQIGYVDGITGNGNPLGGDPWWVAVTAGSFVGGKWFGMSAPLAILAGGALGLVWYAVIKA